DDAVTAAPDYHLTARPNCRVFRPRARLIGIADGGPGISAGIVSPPGIQIVSYTVVKKSAPDHHFTTRPDCRVMITSTGRTDGTCSGPDISVGIVSSTRAQIGVTVESTPDDHFTPGPNGSVQHSRSWRIGGAGSNPGIGAGIISASRVQSADDFVLPT